MYLTGIKVYPFVSSSVFSVCLKLVCKHSAVKMKADTQLWV